MAPIVCVVCVCVCVCVCMCVCVCVCVSKVPAKSHIMGQTSLNLMPGCIKQGPSEKGVVGNIGGSS